MGKGESINNLSPESISVDFEIAIHNALKFVFPDADLWGCFFHLHQNLKKHLSAANLLTRYGLEPVFALNCRMIISLAFVPQNSVIEALPILEEILPNDLEPIISWFTNNYIGRLRANQTRAPPIFPPSLWNVYERTRNHQDRTNNYAEAFHKKVQLILGVAHPTFWKFLDELKKVVRVSDADYELAIAGYDAPRKRPRYIDADKRILNVVQTFDLPTVVEYLRGISQNFLMK